MTKLKLYLDTSVINFPFAFDAPELQKYTKEFFKEYVLAEKYETYISRIVLDEVNKTKDPKRKEDLLGIIVKYKLTILSDSKAEEIESLAMAYMKEGAVSERKKEDALHIAYAVVYGMDVLVSWNFEHLANVNKEIQILAISQASGYFHPFRMTTPLEVMGYER